MAKQITITLTDSPSMRRALANVSQSAREERDYFDGRGGAHGATAEAFERIAEKIDAELA